MTLTQAEMEARYDAERLSRTDYTPLSPAWEAILDITDDPTNDGSEEDEDEEDARENAPVPNVPSGYPTDRALIYTDDRRRVSLH